ncbi:MAG: Omp28-related outer membrane protein [Bacteroidota bacterium]|nr:Omp28-related outer membrane protein [Bacteroidota bacterium]MDX5431935.1 Omp28-related outer membrane protein [Bacteroidota bacterium]MDX5470653.1 Omp28-related outer membrane protein [Bacteroidota bacterium]
MNKSLIVAGIFGLVLFSSCEEEPLPIITEEPKAALRDTTYVNSPASAPQDKIVLFEDFTGVRCPTCPNGHTAIEALLVKYPGRIVPVGIHAGAQEFLQAAPFPGEEDLNTKWGSQILTIITKPNGIPYGIADRLNGSNITTQWEGLCTPRMAANSGANAEVSVIDYDPASRELRYEVKFEIMGDLNEPLYFSTAFTEDSIIGKQEYTQGEYEHYEHNHVLRDMPQFAVNLNPSNNPPAENGRVFIKQYSYTLPENWKPKYCHLIAYIHRAVEVLQVSEVKLQ